MSKATGAPVMQAEQSGRNSNKLKLGIALAFFAAASATTYYTLFREDPRAVAEVVPAERSCEVTCKSCGASYTLPLKEYLARCEARADETQGIPCAECNQATAWLGEPPIEFTDRKWNAGWVGRDMLKANLKAYHAANPEPAGKGLGVEF